MERRKESKTAHHSKRSHTRNHKSGARPNQILKPVLEVVEKHVPARKNPEVHKQLPALSGDDDYVRQWLAGTSKIEVSNIRASKEDRTKSGKYHPYLTRATN